MPGVSAYTLLGLTAMIGAIAGALVFAALRFVAAARDTRSQSGGEQAFLSSALEEAVATLKAQERAMAARAERSERLSGEIISSLTAGLLVVDLDGQVRILNPAARRLLRVPDAMPVQQDFHSLLGQNALAATIEECLRQGVAVIRRSIESASRDGDRAHFGVTVSPLFDVEGTLHGAICLFSDLTAIRELEGQLRLKESLATVGELTAGIAHEFRNGLATIHGYSKLLDRDPLPDNHRQYLDAIRLETEALSGVVTNFLSFATPARLTLTRIDLGAICERAAEDVSTEARALGGSVTVSGEFGPIDGDEVLLRQAFSNLLRNAIEACASVSRAPVVVVRSELERAHHVSHICVEDNGPGIKPDERDRVFRPFFTSKRDGTGLGLALVQKIIVFHNGRVAVGTSPLGGASFQIVLPIVG